MNVWASQKSTPSWQCVKTKPINVPPKNSFWEIFICLFSHCRWLERCFAYITIIIWWVKDNLWWIEWVTSQVQPKWPPLFHYFFVWQMCSLAIVPMWMNLPICALFKFLITNLHCQKYWPHMWITIGTTALQSCNNRKIKLLSRYWENKLQALTK